MAKEQDFFASIGLAIRKERIKQELSQGQLAFDTNLTREFINKVESGRYNILVRKLELIAEALKVNIRDFFPSR